MHLHCKSHGQMQILILNRTITAATVLISVPGHLGLYNLVWMLFLKDYVFTISQMPQLWRVLSAFFITGPQLGLIMDPFFLYHYSSQLETGSPRFSGSGAYAFYLTFVSVVILVSSDRYTHSSFIKHSPFVDPPTHKPRYICPASPNEAVTVPGIEEDYPLRCAASVIRKIK